MSHETVLDLFIWMMIAAAFISGLVCFAVGVLIYMKFTKHKICKVATQNGIDIFAERYGVRRNPDESDDDLVARVNREKGYPQ